MNAPTIIDKNILDLRVERSNFALLLNKCRKSNKLTDVELEVGGKLFPAHRAVLSLYSPVLEAAVSDQWSTSKICPISDQYVDPSIVEPLLHFLYTGSIQLTPDNVHPVCVAAHFLQIATLLEPSVQHLCRLTTVENALSLFEFSVTCELKSLRSYCLRIIARNHEEVFRDPQLLKFSSRIFNDLILGLNELSRSRITLKENTFNCIVRWTEVNLSERLDELPGMLKNILLEELSLKFLTETVSNHRLVKESISCIQAVSAALQSRRDDNLVVLCPNSTRRPRGSSTWLDCQTKVWRKLPDMLQPRSSFSATVVNRKDIVVCGGINPTVSIGFPPASEHLDTVEMFEWSSQTWKQLPRMPFYPKFSSIAALDDHLYVIGKNNHKSSREVVCYTFETQQWQYVKPMSIARYHAKLIEYDGYLYVFGGSAVVERYDPLLDEWTNIANTPESLNYRDIRKVTVHQNKIYIGGYLDVFLDAFDPETNSWIQGLGKSCGGSMVSMNGQLLAARDFSKWIQTFSSDTKQWTNFLELNVHELENCLLVTGQFY